MRHIIVKDPGIVRLDYSQPRSVVLIPGLSIGAFLQMFFHGFKYYEERYLYFLTFLKNPQTHLLAVLSEGVNPALWDYFLGHACRATGLKRADLEKRFHKVFVPAKGHDSLTVNLLRDPKALKKIKDEIKKCPKPAYIEFWRVKKEEVKVAKKLGLPYYSLAPSAFFVNTKSGARKIFKQSKINIAKGFGDLRSLSQAHLALQKLIKISKAPYFLIKLNDEGGGAGILKLERKQCSLDYKRFCEALPLPPGQSLKLFEKYFVLEGGVVEEFIEAKEVLSPSVQFEITPDGKVLPIATHEQILEGTDYLGTHFPAPANYRSAIQKVGLRAAKIMAKYGARGFVAMDLLITRNKKSEPWKIWGIEINARKGGANHTHFWAKYLTHARYNAKRGVLESGTGDICYKASEQFVNEPWLRKIPAVKLIKALKESKLDFDHAKQRGVFIHLLSPIKTYGKIGATVIGHSEREIDRYWDSAQKLVRKLKKS
jgi:hypothetical protein